MEVGGVSGGGFESGGKTFLGSSACKLAFEDESFHNQPIVVVGVRMSEADVEILNIFEVKLVNELGVL